MNTKNKAGLTSIIVVVIFTLIAVFLSYSSTQETHKLLEAAAWLLNNLPFSLFEAAVIGALGTISLYICFGTPRLTYQLMSPKLIRRARRFNLTRGMCISYIFASIAGGLIGTGVGTSLYYHHSWINQYLVFGLFYLLLCAAILMLTTEVTEMRKYLKKGGKVELGFRATFGMFGLFCLIQTVPAWRIIG